MNSAFAAESTDNAPRSSEPQIEVNTDKSRYANGDVITVKGKIENYDFKELHYTVKSPDNNIVGMGALIPNSDGSFQINLVAGGTLWKLAGDYVVELKFGGNTGEVIINYIGGEQVIVSEPEPLISVQTDDSHYDEGDTIVISGTVSSITRSQPIGIMVFLESDLVNISQVTVSQDGSFTNTLIAEGGVWKESGKGIVRVTYGQGNVAETGFTFTLNSEPIETRTNFEVDTGSDTFREIQLVQKIPDWVKTIFVWYAQDQVSEDELLKAIQYLVDEEILIVN